MRAWVVAALVAVAVLPGMAVAARDAWVGAGVGIVQEFGSDECAAIYQIGLERDGPNSWRANVEVYAYPNRWEIFGCLPRGYVFTNVHGNPDDGWVSTVVVPCAIQHVAVGPVGALAAGVSSVEFYLGDYCNGKIDSGRATVAMATPDVR